MTTRRRNLLRVLLTHAEAFGGLHIDTVIADVDAIPDLKELATYVRTIGASLVVSKLAADDSAERHDPQRLSEALRKPSPSDR